MTTTSERQMRSSQQYFPVMLTASTHQGDITKFGANSVGRQCVPNSLSYILKSYTADIDHWKKADLDNILMNGNGLYLSINSSHDYLEIEQIPRTIQMFGKEWSISVGNENHAVLDGEMITASLRESFGYSTEVIVMLGDVTSSSALSIIHRNNAFYTFDPHSRCYRTGLPIGDGTSVVARFSTCDLLSTYLLRLGTTLRAVQFSVWAIQISSQSKGIHMPTATAKDDKSANSMPDIQTKETTTQYQQPQKPLFKCTHCQKQMSSAYRLEQHQDQCKLQQAARANLNLTCQFCQRLVDNTTNLRQHEEACAKRHERISMKHLCKYCHRQIDNLYNLQQHEKACSHQIPCRTKATFTCSRCQKPMQNKANLEKHLTACGQQKKHKGKRKQGQQLSRDAKRDKNTMRMKEARQNPGFRDAERAQDTKRRKEVRKKPGTREREQACDTQQRRERRKQPGVREREQACNTQQRLESRKRPGVREREQACDTQQHQESRKRPGVREREQACDTQQRQESRKRPGIREEEQSRDTSRRKQRRIDPTFRTPEKQQDKTKKQQRRSDPIYQEEQLHRRQVKKFGDSLKESIDLFLEMTRSGPVYVCTSCQQTMFADDVDDVSSLRPRSHKEFLNECQTGYQSVDGKEWLCHTCKRDIYQGLIPKMSIRNKVGFPERPPALELFPLEETVIAPLLPFMTIRSLPVGGQKQIKGNVVHVPNNIASTVETLPRQLDDMGTIMLRLKRKLEHTTAAFQAAIRPQKCMHALQYLKENSTHYKHVMCDLEWLTSVSESTSENRALVEGLTVPEEEADETENPLPTEGTEEAEPFEEVSPSENTQGNLDTLLDEHDPVRVYQDAAAVAQSEHRDAYQDNTRVYNIAPGEGQVPVFRDAEAEYKCFPTIFCGKERPKDEDRPRPISTAMLFKAELRNIDTRVALNIPNIFWKATHLRIKQVLGTCQLALRKLVGARYKNVTAADLINPEIRDTIQRLDEGYRIFRSIRHSPPYFEHRKKEVNAMIRQLGYPSFFFSLSSADTHWVELIRCLAKRVNDQDLSDTYIQDEMTFAEKAKLVASDPASCSRYFHHRVQKFLQLIIMGPHSPIGKVKDFFYRVEFQKRGSPHIHGFVWPQDAPDVNTAPDEEICEHVDQRISCSGDVSLEEQPFIKLQIHSHSRTCKRMQRDKAVCRFGAPWPPMRKTTILYPLEDEDKDCRSELQKKFNEMMKKGKKEKLPATVKTFDEWLQHIDLQEDEYYTIIRSTLDRKKMFLKRAPTEMRINPYMKGLLRAWKANHDIQFVLHPFQCVSYICDYMTKSQKGVSELMQDANDEARAGNMDMKKRFRHIANVLLNAAESPIQQCCYDLLGIPITNSSRKKEFINTNPQDLRVGLAKPLETLKELDPQSKAVTMQSNIDRYARRPRKLENWCLADYVAKTDIEYPKKRSQGHEENEEVDPETLEMHEELNEHREDDGFPYVMQNGHVLHLRRKNKVIRFRRYSKKTDPENYFREMLLLYTSWRSETSLIGNSTSFEDAYKQKQRDILQKQKEFEPVTEELDAAYEEFYSQQQSQESDVGESQDTSEDPVALDDLPILSPDTDAPLFKVDIGPALGIAPTQNEQDDFEQVPMKLTDSEYFNLLGLLNLRQQEFHSHIMHHALYGEDQILAVLHGGAGTGKSTVIKAVSEGLERILRNQPGKDFSGPKIILMAPTGKAAYNIGGQTIHRGLYIPASQRLDYKALQWDSLNTVRSNFNGVDWLIIDEFSMVGKRMLRFIHLRLQEICANQKLFGGMNILLVGDLHQLKPVKDGWIFEDMDGAYGGLAPNLFKENFNIFELSEIMRQKDDKPFAETLNRIRCGTHTPQDMALLRTRLISTQQAMALSHVPHFYVTNAKKDEYNNLIMENSPGKTMTIRAKDVVPTDIPKSEQKKALAAAAVKPVSSAGNLEYQLVVKEGLRYDITANISPLEGIVNGAECTLRQVQPSSSQENLPICIWVEFLDDAIGKDTRRRVGHAYKAYTEKQWTPITPVRRTFVASRNNYTVTRQQYPLQMSSGRTIHKAQSATHEEVVVDMSAPDKTPVHFFEHIHYVAFSRCTKLEGLHIVDINESKIRASANVIRYLEKERIPLELCFSPVYTAPHSFAIAHNNVGSLPHKWPAIKNNKNINAMDVFILAETWLSHKHSTSAFVIPGFRCVRMDSKFRVGHRGMLMYILEEHITPNTKMYQSEHLEALSCEVVIKNQHWNVVSMYKPPKTTPQQLTSELEEVICNIDLTQNTVVIGDMNINIKEDRGKWLLGHMESKYGLHQIIKSSTTWDGTLIDLMFTNNSRMHAHVLGVTWSKHDLIYGTLADNDQLLEQTK